MEIKSVCCDKRLQKIKYDSYSWILILKFGMIDPSGTNLQNTSYPEYSVL